MFDYIKGILTAKSDTQKGIFMTIETNGVGYLFEVTTRDFNATKLDDEIRIYSVLIHREDKMSLCGFLKKEDRDIFNILTSVSGVGVKMALTLLSEFDTPELVGFVLDENFKALTCAKGVGAKLAQKIILELKDKLTNYEIEKPINVSATLKFDNTALSDAQAVLTSLGYDAKEIESAINSIQTDEKMTAEDILKESLHYLSLSR